jgi:hypothetical protein
VVPGVRTEHSPSLAWLAPGLGGKLFLVWRGADDQSLYAATYDGRTWSTESAPPEQIVGTGSSDDPMLYAFGPGGSHHLYMLWKGVQGDPYLYTTFRYPGGGWAPQRHLTADPRAGNGDGHGPALTGLERREQAGRLLAAWKANDGAEPIVYTATGRDGDPPDTYTWHRPVAHPGIRTEVGPALCSTVPQGRVTYLVTNVGHQLSWTTADTFPDDGPANWAPLRPVPHGLSDERPALTAV